ncbi:Hypothetical predicted protein [Paramuricea clavata]|uniref:Bacteriophage T5 Orf172 DNA-binding domain-containing protein n=1 Tax=Paramuricea clavata TaxID=317549 RepID=A0A7D9EYL5_PARCT|nr:Hypothetical predicted protein [Paramuricea clavata]
MTSQYPLYRLVQVEQEGGGSGRWEGPGVVYVMTYICQTTKTKYYKIGCTSRDPEIRLKEVEMKERKHRGNSSVRIQLLGFVHVDKMREAETEAQKHAAEKLGLQKHVGSRGNATDWFTNTRNATTEQQVLDAVGEACGGSVYQQYDLDTDINCYTKKGTEFTEEPLDFMSITAKAVKEANKRYKSGYVFVTKVKVDGSSNRYSYYIDCTEGDPVKRVQEMQNHELTGFVYAKQMERAKKKVEDAVIASGYKRV